MRKKSLQLQRRRPVTLRILLSLQLQEDEKMHISLIDLGPRESRVILSATWPCQSSILTFLFFPRRYLVADFRLRFGKSLPTRAFSSVAASRGQQHCELL